MRGPQPLTTDGVSSGGVTELVQYLYKCTECGEFTPSPGRLEGNWCPHCDAKGTVELVREGIVGEFADAMDRHQAGPGEVPELDERIERARDAAEGDLAEALGIVTEETWPVLVHIVAEEAQVSIVDLYRAMGFDTKTETYRQAVKLVHEGLLEQLEEQRFVPTDLGRQAVAAVREA